MINKGLLTPETPQPPFFYFLRNVSTEWTDTVTFCTRQTQRNDSGLCSTFFFLIESWEDKQVSRCFLTRAWERARKGEKTQVCGFACVSAYLTNHRKIKATPDSWQQEWKTQRREDGRERATLHLHTLRCWGLYTSKLLQGSRKTLAISILVWMLLPLCCYSSFWCGMLVTKVGRSTCYGRFAPLDSSFWHSTWKILPWYLYHLVQLNLKRSL